jgi:hypothetical protein
VQRPNDGQRVRRDRKLSPRSGVKELGEQHARVPIGAGSPGLRGFVDGKDDGGSSNDVGLLASGDAHDRSWRTPSGLLPQSAFEAHEFAP